MQILKQEIYDAITKSAFNLFKKYSYENVSITDVAKGANISTGNVYRYYDNKKDVYDKTVLTAYEKLDNIADKLLRDKSKSLEKIINNLIDVYKAEKYSVIILLGIKNTINKELLNKYESIFIEILSKNKDEYLDVVHAKSCFYAFREIIDKDYKAIELNDKLFEYVEKYVNEW